MDEDPSLQNRDRIEDLAPRLGYTFSKPELLENAFRHASYVNELVDPGLQDNERLEFLGDAVLDLAVSHILMELYRDAREGDLSKYRAFVVNERGLYQVAKGLGLGEYLLLGKGEESTGGRDKPSILADTMEAVIGALYLDAGFGKTLEIVQTLFQPLLQKFDAGEAADDFKSLLQEYTQEAFKMRPEYLLVDESGPAHDRTFRVTVSLGGRAVAGGEGKSKKEAEQRAAKEAFLCLKKDCEGP